LEQGEECAPLPLSRARRQRTRIGGARLRLRSIAAVNGNAPVFGSPPDLPPPNGYSHVVTIPAGRLVWTSGQVGIAADGSVPGGYEAQTRLAFDNIGRALADAGAGWVDVVKLTFYVVSTDELATVRAVRDEYVNTDAPPTSSLVRVAGLFRDDLVIEVEAVASIA